MKPQIIQLRCWLVLFSLAASLQATLGYYDPAAQRWINRDPIYEPGFQSVSTRNSASGCQARKCQGADVPETAWARARTASLSDCQYRFCANEPTSDIDPLGLFSLHLPFYYTCPTITGGSVPFAAIGRFICTGTFSVSWTCPSPAFIVCLNDALRAMNLGCLLGDGDLFTLGCKLAGLCFRAHW
jgi:hypothetical protein